MARRLLLAYLTLIVIVLLILEVPLGLTYRDRQLEDLRAAVQGDAVVLASFAEDGLEADVGASDQLEDLATGYTERTGGRVVVVDRDGVAVLDSAPLQDATTLRDFSSRPEVADALAGQVSTGTRHSDTLGTRLLYVAVPVASSGVIYGAVRITFPTSTVDARVRRNWMTLGLIGAVGEPEQGSGGAVAQVLDGDGPALTLGRASPHAEITPEVDETARDVAERVGDEIGGPALADAAEVDADPRWQLHGAGRGIEPDAVAAGRRRARRDRPVAGGAVAVVSGGHQRVEHGGVEAPAGGTPPRDGVAEDGPGERRHRHRAPARLVEPAHVAAGEEAAPARLELGDRRPGGQRRIRGVGADEPGSAGRAHRGPREEVVGARGEGHRRLSSRSTWQPAQALARPAGGPGWRCLPMVPRRRSRPPSCGTRPPARRTRRAGG
jgi:hypothetical protein